jgi:cell division protein FtsB
VLLRTIIGSNPAASVALRKHILEILKAVVRLGLHKQFAEEVGELRSIFDETLALTWAAMKAGGMAMDQFWEAYGPLADATGYHSEMEQIFAEQGTFTHVKAQILKVTSGSALGLRLFGGAATMLKVEDFSAQVDAQIAQLKQQDEVTEAEIKAIKDTIELLKRGFVKQRFLTCMFCCFVFLCCPSLEVVGAIALQVCLIVKPTIPDSLYLNSPTANTPTHKTLPKSCRPPGSSNISVTPQALANTNLLSKPTHRMLYQQPHVTLD